jgi:hypothetical protein
LRGRPVQMTDWKRPLFIGLGWGFGTAMGLALLVGGFLWYQSRPKPPKPWNSAAIKAEYDTTETEGDKNNVVFVYTLENTTDFDYRVENAHEITASAKLREQNNLSPLSESGSVDYPIFVPAKKRVRFSIHINYPYPDREKSDANLDERIKFRQGIEKYTTDTFSNLDGFDLLDQTNRYEIIFPAGWKHARK